MHTWDEAAAQWRAENVYRTKKWQYDEALFLRWLAPHLSGVPLDRICAAHIQAIRQAKIDEGVSACTVNAYLSAVRAILRAAVEWEWIAKAPHIKLLRRPPTSVCHITPEQAQRFLAMLLPHARDTAALALETGLRKRNITGLLWEWIDLRKRTICVPATQAKGRKPINIPITNVAAQIIERWQGAHATHVFHYRGQPIKELNTKAFRRARVAAGLGRFRWHDLRHTWASWHAMNGTPLLILQRLGGWNTVQMVNHYAHLQTEDLRPWVNAVRKRPRARRAVLRLAA